MWQLVEDVYLLDDTDIGLLTELAKTMERARVAKVRACIAQPQLDLERMGKTSVSSSDIWSYVAWEKAGKMGKTLGTQHVRVKAAIRSVIARLGPDAPVREYVEALKSDGLIVSKSTAYRVLDELKAEAHHELLGQELQQAVRTIAPISKEQAVLFGPELRQDMRNRNRIGVARVMDILDRVADNVEVLKAGEILSLAQASQIMVQNVLAIDKAEAELQGMINAAEQKAQAQDGMIDVTTKSTVDIDAVTPLQQALKRLQEERASAN